MTKLDQTKQEINAALEAHYGSSPIFFEILMEVPMLWEGWEMDNTGYVVTTSKKQILFINSSHGSLFVDPHGLEFLKDRVKSYEKAESETQKAVELLKKVVKS